MSENLKVSRKDNSDANFDFLMPDFVLCIRDFTLELEIDGKECTEDEYFEHCLMEKKAGRDELREKYNRPRQCIKQYFTKRKAFTFDRPASRKVMKNLDQAKTGDLSKDFIQETEKFLSYVYERPNKMLLNKKPVTGRMLVELLDSLITAMKNGTVPCIEDAITVMAKQENENLKESAIKNVRAELANLNVPVKNKTELLEKKFKIQTQILVRLNSELLFDDGHAVEISAKNEMDKIFKDFEEENDRQIYEICYKRLNDIYDDKMKGNVDTKAYMVSGGYEKYKNDMQMVMEKYENNPELEKIDRIQIKQAKRDFQSEKLQESEAIMTADKSISEKEMNEKQKQLKSDLEEELKMAKAEEEKRLQTKLEMQAKQQEVAIANARLEQEEKSKADTKAYYEGVLARREDQTKNVRWLIPVFRFFENLFSL